MKQGYELVHSYLEVLADQMDTEGEGDSAEKLREAWRSFVPVPRAEYERLRRALWKLMQESDYSHPNMEGVGDFGDFFASIGFAVTNKERGWGRDWTPAAHAFAASMQNDQTRKEGVG